MVDLIGQTLGKYQITKRLGRGGMAEVYKAYQPGLERDVALKIMHSHLAEDEQFIGRFQREAKAVAALHHAHIVQVYDFDQETDVYYMVMEFIEGDTLKARLNELHVDDKIMPLEEVGSAMRSLCSALDYAHNEGCIHRDIKPANVMVDKKRLVLTDFGIASIVGGAKFTATGAMVGTPAYMAPEQAEGLAADKLSDIYSLGVILYEMVTGRLPYDADTPLAIILKHINDPLPMPSEINTDVPPPVEKVILKALAKRPEDRFQSAKAMAEALDAALVGLDLPEDVEATSILMPEQDIKSTVSMPAEPTSAEKKTKRSWLPFALGGAVLVGIALIAIFAIGALWVVPRIQANNNATQSVGSDQAISGDTEAAGYANMASVVESIKAGQQVLVENPTTPQDWYGNARVYQLRGDNTNAILSYESYFEFNLEFVDPYDEYLALLRATEGAAYAKQHIRELRTAAPDNLSLDLTWARIQATPEERLDELIPLGEKYPQYAPVFYYIGADYDRLLLEGVTASLLEKQNSAYTKLFELEESLIFSKFFIDKAKAQELLENAHTKLETYSLSSSYASEPEALIYQYAEGVQFIFTIMEASPEEILYSLDDPTPQHSTGKVQGLDYVNQSVGPVVIPIGDHTIYFSYIDKNGVESQVFEQAFTVEPVVANWIQNPPDFATNISSGSFLFTSAYPIEDAMYGLRYSIDSDTLDSEATAYMGILSVEIPEIDQGDHILYIQAIDPDGVESKIVEYEFTVN
jgi:serine/threonine protein kinase